MALNLTSLLSKVNPDPSKAGKTLLFLNALGMIFAALSNTFACATDKNTSKKDKKFLVPAGVVTGIANIGIYYGMTTKIINKLGGKKIYPKENQTVNLIISKLKDGTFEVLTDDKGQKYVEVKGTAHNIIEKLEKGGTFDKEVKKFVNKEIKKAQNGNIFGFGKKTQEYIVSMKESLLDGGKPSQYAQNLFKDNIKSGMGVLGAFIGAVIGCAIITPIIRDISAYFVQKRMEKHNPDLQNKPYMPYFDPSHLKVNIHGKKQPLSMKNYMAFTSSGSNLKV